MVIYKLWRRLHGKAKEVISTALGSTAKNIDRHEETQGGNATQWTGKETHCNKQETSTGNCIQSGATSQEINNKFKQRFVDRFSTMCCHILIQIGYFHVADSRDFVRL